MILEDSVKQRLNSIKLHTDPLAQSQLIAELRRDTQLRSKDISDYLEIQPSYLSHLIRIAKLPEIIIDGYLSKHLTFTHLILISRLKTQEDMVQLYEEVLKGSLSVAQTEQRIRDMLYHIDNSGRYLSNNRITSIKDKIERSLSEETCKVSIIQTRIKAKITIEVSGNLEKTSRFLDAFGNKFRQKREKKSKTDVILPETESLKPIDVSIEKPIAENTDVKEDNSTASDESNDDKKYRFDPDF